MADPLTWRPAKTARTTYLVQGQASGSVAAAARVLWSRLREEAAWSLDRAGQLRPAMYDYFLLRCVGSRNWRMRALSMQRPAVRVCGYVVRACESTTAAPA